ncbi:MAG: hypothetical protein GDA38_19235 [Hormoscilla sp. SP12CHS1]|nr:hypothetical protein [Hormoscilla sp. SP12CHS1]
MALISRLSIVAVFLTFPALGGGGFALHVMSVNGTGQGFARPRNPKCMPVSFYLQQTQAGDRHWEGGVVKSS